MYESMRRLGYSRRTYKGFRLKIIQDFGYMVRALILPHNLPIILPSSMLDDAP